MKKGKLKKMKQLCMLLSAIFLGMSAVACGNDTAENQNADVQASADETASESSATEETISDDDATVEEDEGFTFDPDKYMFTVTDENGDVILGYNIPENYYVLKTPEYVLLNEEELYAYFCLICTEQIDNVVPIIGYFYISKVYMPDKWDADSLYELEETVSIESTLGNINIESWTKEQKYDWSPSLFVTTYDIAKINYQNKILYVELCSTIELDENANEEEISDAKKIYSLVDILPNMFDENNNVSKPDLGLEDEAVDVYNHGYMCFLSPDYITPCYGLFDYDMDTSRFLYCGEERTYEAQTATISPECYITDIKATFSDVPVNIYFNAYNDRIDDGIIYEYFSDIEQFKYYDNDWDVFFNKLEISNVESNTSIDTNNGTIKIYYVEYDNGSKTEVAVCHNNGAYIWISSDAISPNYQEGYLQSVLESL